MKHRFALICANLQWVVCRFAKGKRKIGAKLLILKLATKNYQPTYQSCKWIKQPNAIKKYFDHKKYSALGFVLFC